LQVLMTTVCSYKPESMAYRGLCSPPHLLRREGDRGERAVSRQRGPRSAGLVNVVRRKFAWRTLGVGELGEGGKVWINWVEVGDPSAVVREAEMSDDVGDAVAVAVWCSSKTGNVHGLTMLNCLCRLCTRVVWPLPNSEFDVGPFVGTFVEELCVEMEDP
jgi:hypothetical protein